jgi:hypothetical protein
MATLTEDFDLECRIAERIGEGNFGIVKSIIGCALKAVK